MVEVSGIFQTINETRYSQVARLGLALYTSGTVRKWGQYKPLAKVTLSRQIISNVLCCGVRNTTDLIAAGIRPVFFGLTELVAVESGSNMPPSSSLDRER